MALDANGLHQDRPNAITTFTGKRVEPLNMALSDIDIVDIAHALSRMCRYNGHVNGFYSVARHCVLVSEALDGTGYELAGLLHDAAEAYLGDVVRPLKAAPQLAAFREADQVLDSQIAEAFSLPWPQPAEVLEADRRMLLDNELPFPDGLRWTQDSTPQEDERDFLARFRKLTGSVVGKQMGAPIIIGLSGYAQSGKDTAGRVLAEFFRFERRAFADTMRAFALATDPYVRTNIGTYVRLSELIDAVGYEAAKQNEDVRRFYQRVGTEGGRNTLGENVWVDAAMRGLEPTHRYVFTDVRFPNEFDAIKAAGGEVWRIARPGTSAVNMHPSETALDLHTFDRTIHNSTSIHAFDRAIHDAAANLFLKR